MSRFPRRTALAISGVVISVSYLGFLGGAELPHRWAVPAIVGVSVLSTLGELIYAGSSTALVAATRSRARARPRAGAVPAVHRFQPGCLPAIITALAARGPAALWVTLTAATLLAAAAVARPSGLLSAFPRGRNMDAKSKIGVCSGIGGPVGGVPLVGDGGSLNKVGGGLVGAAEEEG